MVSLPIPERGSGVSYGQLQTPRGTMYELMCELGFTRYREGGAWHPLSPRAEAHLDPDLVPEARPRDQNWKCVFGQCEGQQTHLRNSGVCEGDLFLFFGTFDHTTLVNGRLTFTGKPFHAVFGYMQIGQIVTVNSSTSLPWCAEHPHLANRARKNNTLYIGADRLAGTDRPGAGVVRYAQKRMLSAEPGRVSRWRLPGFFHPEACGRFLSCHPNLHVWKRDGDDVLLSTKSPAQEYVIDATPQMAEWAYALINN